MTRIGASRHAGVARPFAGRVWSCRAPIKPVRPAPGRRCLLGWTVLSWGRGGGCVFVMTNTSSQGGYVSTKASLCRPPDYAELSVVGCDSVRDLGWRCCA